jgi:hypothetical protein
MTDIDFLSENNSNETEFIHWMVVNIPGNKIKEGQTKIE